MFIHVGTNVKNNATCHILSLKNNNKHDANGIFKKHKTCYKQKNNTTGDRLSYMSSTCQHTFTVVWLMT